jgi:hypothetical protein
LCFTGMLVISRFLERFLDLGISFTPSMFITETWVLLLPLCLVVNLVASLHWRSGLIVFISYFITLFFICTIEIAIHHTLNWSQVLLFWVFLNLPLLFLAENVLNSRIRAVGPMVFTFLFIAFNGFWPFTLGLVYLTEQNVKLLSTIEVVSLGDFGSIGTSMMLYLIIFPVWVIVGWLTLLLLKWLYLHKRQSDLTLVIDPIWLMFAYFYSLFFLAGTQLPFAIVIISFGMYKIVTWAGFAWLNRNRRKTPGVKLLILRVFALGKRSEQLYSTIAKAWRYVGNIQFITGPDLAASTVSPSNFLDFISGKLSSHFIDSREQLERRIAEADTLPGLDGRYPILDFFCHEDTWKMVLSRLACDTDVVLVDLRSFSSNNLGCKFEIAELIQLVPIEKVVFVIDKTTDQDLMTQSIQEAWENIRSTSPNKLAERNKLNILNYEGRSLKNINEILYALSKAAAC